MNRLVRAITGNWPLKITSLALALLLWLVASGEEPVTSVVTVNLDVRPPAGHMVVRGPEPVEAVVVGPRRELLKLSTASILVTRTVSDSAAADAVELAIGPADVELPRGVAVQVKEVRPRSVTVELDSLADRSIPIRPMVEALPDSGFSFASEVVVSPVSVRVRGPLQHVRRIDSVRTLPLELGTIHKSVDERVRLDTSALGPVQLSPPLVTVTLAVAPIEARVIYGVPVHMPAAAARAYRLDPDSVAVMLRGPRLRLADLSRDSVHVVVESLGTTPRRIQLRVLAPRGVRGEARPDSATLLRRGGRG